VRARILIASLLLLAIPSFWLLGGRSRSGFTRLEIEEAGTGKKIFSASLRDGEQVVMAWKNSLFGLRVTEVFQARAGALVLTQITFADPSGSVPPTVRAADVDDLYQTGDPFFAEGLARPFKRMIFRVGEIGDPKLKIKGRVIEFKQEVGFGGGVVLTATNAGIVDVIKSLPASLCKREG
jgi:hypothetical protein